MVNLIWGSSFKKAYKKMMVDTRSRRNDMVGVYALHTSLRGISCRGNLGGQSHKLPSISYELLSVTVGINKDIDFAIQNSNTGIIMEL